MPQIDNPTFRDAINKFENLYGTIEEIGLSRKATHTLLRYKIIPKWVKNSNQNQAKELEYICFEFHKILTKTMKVYRAL